MNATTQTASQGQVARDNLAELAHNNLLTAALYLARATERAAARGGK